MVCGFIVCHAKSSALLAANFFRPELNDENKKARQQLLIEWTLQKKLDEEVDERVTSLDSKPADEEYWGVSKFFQESWGSTKASQIVGPESTGLYPVPDVAGFPPGLRVVWTAVDGYVLILLAEPQDNLPAAGTVLEQIGLIMAELPENKQSMVERADVLQCAVRVFFPGGCLVHLTAGSARTARQKVLQLVELRT